MTGPGTVIVDRTDDGVAVLRLNRPHKRNAIDDTMQAELIAALETLAADQELRALIVTGEGVAFCAGGDIEGMSRRLEAPPGEVAARGRRRLLGTGRMILLLYELGVPTVAAVNGAAFGVGMDLALACDFAVAAEAARFSMSFVQRGLVPDGGGMYFLPRRIGLTAAKDLIYSGRVVDAAEAERLGLVDRVVAGDELADEARRLAVETSRGSVTAVGLAKAILDRSLETDLRTVLARSADAQAICYTTDEHRRSVEEFLESRRRGGGGAAPPEARR